MQRLVAVEAAAGVQQEFGRAAEQESEARARALQAVVQDAQDLLVVGAARLGVGELVEVDQLVEADQQTAVAGQPHEAGDELELVVEVGVVDDGADAERLARVGPGRELAAQPAHGVGLELLVPLVVPAPVRGDDLGEVVAAGHLRRGWPAAPGGSRPPRVALLPRLLQGRVTNRSTTLASAPPSGFVRVARFAISSA